MTLVDTGLKSAPARILAALAEIGSGPVDVTTIVLTHAHHDHAGGAADLAQRTRRGITVHEDDAEFVRTGKSAPADRSMRLGRLMSRARPGRAAAPVARTMADGELLRRQRASRAPHPGAHARALLAAARGLGDADHR